MKIAGSILRLQSQMLLRIDILRTYRRYHPTGTSAGRLSVLALSQPAASPEIIFLHFVVRVVYEKYKCRLSHLDLLIASLL